MRNADTQATVLIGRDGEVRELVERIDAARGAGGGALLVRGAAGVGKSSLLETAKLHAASTGFRILATTGIQSESQLPFAGVHQLLWPVLHEVDRLSASDGNTIRSALDPGNQTAPSLHLTALSVLHLLSECAESSPFLLVVDDAQWLDALSAEVLVFVARRLDHDPIILLAAIRDGVETPFTRARFPELRVERLSDSDARTLLAGLAPDLAPTLRDRILAESEGNPLALAELSVALSASSARLPSTTHLPLTERLESAFADRLSSLTSGARSLLHVAAVDTTGVLRDVLRAASTLDDRTIALEAVAETEAAGFIEINTDRLRFRHPLMRSAIHQSITLERRQAIHMALASTLEGDPNRRLWHRAAAAVGASEEIAAELDAAAASAFHRGAVGLTLEALERAIQLGDPARRGGRLIRAAQQAMILGRHDDVVRLLGAIDDSALGPLERPQVAWLRNANHLGTWSGATQIVAIAESADQMRIEGDVEGGYRVLTNIANRCWWTNLDEEARARIIAVAEQFTAREHHTGITFVLALVAPVERGATALERLSQRWGELHGVIDLKESQLLGLAALGLGDFARAELILEAHILHCRTRGLLGALSLAFAFQAWVKIHRGDWKQAASLASEGARLAEETGQREVRALSELATAMIAAYRGDLANAETFSLAGEEVFLPRDADPHLALVQCPRGAAALADGRYDEAYQHLRRIFDSSDNAYHPHVRSWALIDLVDAAVHSGHEDEAVGFVEELQRIASRTHSPLLEASLEVARPVLTPSTEATFQAALASGLAGWPFARARLQLAYGLWLRRQRRHVDARAPLREARETFDALGAAPWGERARKELRASGETSRRRTYALADALSPQELQIAQLAASGLSNKEIGQQLFLSHRTVGSHLYRIFPKLGITARSHLRAALQSQS